VRRRRHPRLGRGRPPRPATRTGARTASATPSRAAPSPRGEMPSATASADPGLLEPAVRRTVAGLDPRIDVAGAAPRGTIQTSRWPVSHASARDLGRGRRVAGTLEQGSIPVRQDRSSTSRHASRAANRSRVRCGGASPGPARPTRAQLGTASLPRTPPSESGIRCAAARRAGTRPARHARGARVERCGARRSWSRGVGRGGRGRRTTARDATAQPETMGRRGPAGARARCEGLAMPRWLRRTAARSPRRWRAAERRRPPIDPGPSGGGPWSPARDRTG
jgi:hypothetical protein